MGHNNRITLDKPKLIEVLRSKRIRDIACGSSHSAAITSSGELYTWGLGEYGRLGHNDNCTQLKPKLVQALVGQRIVQVACGSRDAQTLALTDDGKVYSWGDGDFGKLGRGGSGKYFFFFTNNCFSLNLNLNLLHLKRAVSFHIKLSGSMTSEFSKLNAVHSLV